MARRKKQTHRYNSFKTWRAAFERWKLDKSGDKAMEEDAADFNRTQEEEKKKEAIEEECKKDAEENRCRILGIKKESCEGQAVFPSCFVRYTNPDEYATLYWRLMKARKVADQALEHYQAWCRDEFEVHTFLNQRPPSEILLHDFYEKRENQRPPSEILLHDFYEKREICDELEKEIGPGFVKLFDRTEELKKAIEKQSRRLDRLAIAFWCVAGFMAALVVFSTWIR